ncbi:MAG: bifunctional methylenetetrahydrofolate dehydrogenase/methenyltetrahydrofolate cyclohydrolase FolD [Alphaproteobacteria bacterium]|nr:bifunctional methylenetetrahydrofolate dehydrogenase/methenyltetrahydrofolate cyclohydrolase FolD [Alphaproteobacteria bacterium]
MHSEHIILDGKKLAIQLQNILAKEIARLPASPTLAVVVIGDNPASAIYVRNKEKAAQKVGIKCIVLKFAEDITQQELEIQIKQLNLSNEINGIIIQQPVPQHLDILKLLTLIHPQKDVDGFSPLNLGLLTMGDTQAIKAATPKGIMRLLQETGISLSGKNAIVIGRSNIVGKPMAQMLLQADCTVTIAHSKTQNLYLLVKQADIVVAACGVPYLVKADWIKNGAIVIDVGINKINGKLCGDVDFEAVKNKVSYITPVPGGVGPMTVTMLLQNTYEAFIRQNCKQ